MILIQDVADKLGISLSALYTYFGRPEIAKHKKYDYDEVTGRRRLYIIDFDELERKLTKIRPDLIKKGGLKWSM